MSPDAEQYIVDVLSGEQVAGAWIISAVQRHVDDLERQNTDDFPYYYDQDEADDVLQFFLFLRHSKGEWAGERFRLEPWQEFVVCSMHGWRRSKDGMRRFQTVYLEVARKNGKSTLAAAIGLYAFDGDDEPGAEVYSAATKFDQAKITHSEAMRMVKASSYLRDHIGTHVNNIFCLEANSVFRPVSSDHDTLDGLNVHCAIIDEVHAHKTRDMWDIMETATTSRRSPIMFGITTAGFDRKTVCWELHDYGQRILDKDVEDETFLCFIFSLDAMDEWEDEKMWAKANPNIGVSVKIDDLRRKAKKAAAIPTALNTFLRLHMDMWTESATRWIPHDAWMACSRPLNISMGRQCFSGLDLSSNKDITAFVLVFPPLTPEDRYQVLCRFFIPADQIEMRSKEDRVPYDRWVEAGLIIATPGKVVNYDYVLDEIGKLGKEYDICEIAFDRWGANMVVQKLEDMGFIKPEDDKFASRHLISAGQGYGSMSGPMKELENLILDEKMSHGGNETLAWMCANVVATQNPAGDIKPDKSKSIERIDGIVALIMALNRAMLQEFTYGPPPIPSIV